MVREMGSAHAGYKKYPKERYEQNGQGNNMNKPVTIVAPADYGVSKIPEVEPGDTGLGFKGPLVPKIKQSEVIFCNGLENCPVQ